MFNVGGPEIVVILLVALVILGPDQLPKAMRTFGNVMAEVRKVSGGFQAEMRKAMDTLDTTGSDGEKPQSGTMATPTKADTAATPADADVTEVVARNDAPASTEPSGPVETVSDRPTVDPADRAAG